MLDSLFRFLFPAWHQRVKNRRYHARAIFTYWDGTRWRVADPLPTGKELERAVGDVAARLDELAAPLDPADPAAWAARRDAVLDLAAKVRAVFGLPAADDADGPHVGLSAAEVVALLRDYLEFLGGLTGGATTTPAPPENTAAPR